MLTAGKGEGDIDEGVERSSPGLLQITLCSPVPSTHCLLRDLSEVFCVLRLQSCFTQANATARAAGWRGKCR